MNDIYKIVLVDDHVLFSNSLKSLIDSFPEYKVDAQFKNGREFINHLTNTEELPDLVLLDVNMPIMSGIETMKWLHENIPMLKTIVVSMKEDDITVIQMIKFGAKGYLFKDIDPNQFKIALDQVIQKGFYYTDSVNETILKEMSEGIVIAEKPRLKERELEFLNWVCSELTYKEIAGKMFLSPKTVDGYRDTLFRKLKVHSRTGLALYAIKHDLVTI